MQEKCVHFLKQRKLGTKPGYHFLDLPGGNGNLADTRTYPGLACRGSGEGFWSAGLTNCQLEKNHGARGQTIITQRFSAPAEH